MFDFNFDIKGNICTFQEHPLIAKTLPALTSLFKCKLDESMYSNEHLYTQITKTIDGQTGSWFFQLETGNLQQDFAKYKIKEIRNPFL